MGNVDPTPATFTWTVDTQPPLLALALDPAFDSEPLGDLQTTFAVVNFVGQTDPNLVVTLTPTSASATADKSGNFSFSNIPLTLGPNPFTAQVTDPAGNSTTTPLTITRIAPTDCLFDETLSGWTITESGGSPLAQGGVVPENCEAIMTEGDSFLVTLERTEVPSTPSALTFTYSDLDFDSTAANQIKDAFEAALVDTQGQALVFTITPGRDAFFNASDGQPVVRAVGTTQNDSIVTVDLSHLAVGTSFNLIFRLINNDADTTTSVRITDVRFVEVQALIAVAPHGVIPFKSEIVNPKSQIRAKLSPSVALQNASALAAETQFPIASNITVPPGFIVEVFATIERPVCLAFPPSGSQFGSDLFVGAGKLQATASQFGDDYVLRISSDGMVVPFATLLPEADPVALKFPPNGSPFGDYLFVSCNNRDGGRLGDYGGTIQRVDTFGNVSDFTPVGEPAGFSEPAGMAFGPGGDFGTDLYVANCQNPPADIYRVSTAGALTVFYDDGVSGGLCATDIEFAPSASPLERTRTSATLSIAIVSGELLPTVRRLVLSLRLRHHHTRSNLDRAVFSAPIFTPLFLQAPKIFLL